MTAIFTGLGAGAERGSGNVLGGAGLLGGGTLGRSGEQVLLNAATGNLMLQQRDEMLIGRGPDAAIMRTYNSQGDLSDDNGDNWRQSTDRRVYGLTGTVSTSGSTVKRVSGDGSEITYTWNATASAYLATDGSGAYDKVTWSAGDSTWTWTDGDSQLTESYAHASGSSYFITTQTDTVGNALSFSYVASTDKIDKVTTANGEYVQYSWSGNNVTQITTGYTDLVASTAKTLTRTRYGYDGSNRLTSVTVDLTPEDNSVTDGKTYVTTYTYDGTSKRVATITQTDGSSLTIGYDGSNRVHTLTQAVASGVNRITTIDYYTGYTNVTDAVGQVTRLDYDSSDQLTKITTPMSQATQFAYNGNGDVTSVTDALGNATAYSSFTAFGQAQTVTDRLGNVTTRTFGAKNELLTETVTGSDTASSGASHTTRYVYDGLNLLRYRVSADGRVTAYVYANDAGAPSKISEFASDFYPVGSLAPSTALSLSDIGTWGSGLSHVDEVVLTKFFYDARGNISTQQDFAGENAGGAAVAAKGYRQTTYVYDQAGRALSRTILGVNTETFVYDAFGRVTASTDLNGATTSIAFNDSATTTVVTLASGLVQTSTYNKAGELVAFGESGTGVTTATSSYAYDSLGRLRMATDATGHNSYVIYDGAGREVGQVDHYGRLTEYKYDADNRLIATIVYANTLASKLTTLADATQAYDLNTSGNRPTASSDDLWTWRIYDADDRMVEAIGGDGAATSYQYDASNRLVATVDYVNRLTSSQISTIKTTPPTTAVLPSLDSAKDAVSRTFYDKDGNLVGTLDGEGYLTRTIYNAAGLIVQTTAFATQVASATTRATGTFADLLTAVGSSSADRSTHYVYDGEGLLRYRIDASNTVVGYNYQTSDPSSEFGPCRVVTQYATPIAALSSYLLAAVDAAITTSTSDRATYSIYDSAGRPVYTIDPAGAVTAASYDSVGRLIKTTQFATVRTTTALPDLATMTTWASANAQPANDRVTRNYYDTRSDLAFTIDAEGYVTRFDHDVERRLVGSVRWNTPVSATDSTTLAGVAALVGGTYVATAISYDNDGRVASTTDGDGVVTSYAYNANGTLGSTYAAYGTADQVRTYFLHDGAGHVTSRYDAYGAAEQTLTQYAYDGFGQIVTTTDPNGNTLTSTYDRVGQVLSQTDQEALTTSYQYNAFGDVIATTDPRSGVGYAYYDVLGRVTATRDVANRVTETAYTVFGEVASVTQRYNVASGSTGSAPSVTADTARDAVTAFTYDKLGRWLTRTDAESAVTTATYNAFGQVATRTDPFAGSTTIQTSLTYDRRGLLKTQIVDSASGGKAITTSYGYDAFGRAITLTDPNSKVTTSTYDKEGRVLTTTDALSHTTTYTYDARGNLAAVTDALGNVTRYVYDKLDRQIVTIDALGAVTTNSYDADGNLVATRDYLTTISLTGMALKVSIGSLTLPTTNAGDHVTHYSYDKDGRLVFAIDALMHVIKYQYDGNGNINRIVKVDATIGVDSSGLYTQAWVTAALVPYGSTPGKRIDRAVFNAADQQVYLIDALGQVTRYFYDALGSLTKTVGYTTLYTSPTDASDATMDTWVSSNGATGDRTTRAYYDRDGRLRYSIDALGDVTRIDYDKAGNVTKQTAYADAYSATDSTTLANLDSNYASLPSTARVTQFNYDTAGRLIETIDPEGFSTKLVLDQVGHITSSTAAYGLSAASVTTFAYDDAGRVTSTTRGYGAAEATTTAYTYDALNRVTQATIGYGTADAATTKMDYDALGRTTQQTRGYGTSEAASTQTAYDAFGRAITMTDARGSVIANVYDAIDELLTRTEQLETGTTDDQVTAFTYDNFGNAVKTVDARGNASFAYFDKLDRVTRQVDAEKYVTDTAYTRGDQVASVKRWANALTGTVVETTLPSDPTTDSTHDATTAFTYDKADRLTATQDAAGFTESYTLDAFGERTTVTNKLGGASTYTFDKRGLLLTETLPITTKNSGGTSISVVNTYAYDARGNRTQMVEAYGAVEARTTTYAYDKLDRLTTTTHDAVTVVNDDLTSTSSVTPTEQIKYDRRGNVIETIDAAGAHSQIWYDHLDRAIAQVVQTDIVSSTAKGTLMRLVYDANGNVTSSKTYGDLITVPSDATGSIPTPVSSTNYRETTYAYDRADRLTTTTVASLLTGEWNGSSYATTTGNVVTTLYYDKNGNVTRQQDARGNSIYSWYDKLGRKTAQVDAETYLTTWTLDAEGNALSETRFATAVGTFTPGSTPPTVSTNAADRTTAFSYDKNGRRLQEQRSSVAYASIDTSNGAVTTGTGTSTVTYTYNGLGEVLSKVEANGDTTAYTYDATGRLTLETGQSFRSNAWTSGADDATPRTAYAYDGLNNLKSTRVQAAATANDTNDRITAYTYGAGGRLATMTDASGFAHTYGYDIAGRTVRDSYVRVKSDASSVTEAIVYRYDLAGRVTTQTQARLSGSTWVFTDAGSVAYDAVRMRYDAYGAMTGRGVTAGPGATAAYQEVFDYDTGGRLWHSNSGDGVDRFYVYDKGGNQSLTLTSTGADLSALTLANYTASLTSSGDTSTSGAVTTISVYDKNGQATATRAPDRELTAIGSGTVTLTTGKTYNAFGEVASETDARGYVTSFTYNTMGRMTRKVSPQVSVTAENGAQSNVNPTDNYAYDLSGRLVAVTDANSHVTTRLLLAGTGHGGTDAQVTKEFHADTGVAETKYDVFGDARSMINELGYATLNDYDKLARLITVTHPQRAASTPGNESGAAQQLVDHYVYDGLGQRTGHWNSQFGSSYVETTDYDAKGRVTATVGFAGDTMSYAYSAFTGSIATSGLGTFGGWTRTTTNGAASLSMTDKTDYFGRTVDTVDYGSHDYDLGFDKGGRLVTRTNAGGESIGFTWYNSGLAAGQTGTQGTAAYTYDANGNRLTESFAKGGTTYRTASATYDALGRMTHWEDRASAVGGSGTATDPIATDWEYDAVGNVRHAYALYRSIQQDGSLVTTYTPWQQDNWYLYDAVNRVTVSQGSLSGSRGAGTIDHGAAGAAITYDLAGQRKTATYAASLPSLHWVYVGPGGQLDVPTGDPQDGGHWEVRSFFEYHDRREDYVYTADGQLAAVAKADSWSDPGAQPSQYAQDAPETVWHEPPATGAALTTIGRDALGRIVHYKEQGSSGSYERTGITYDRANRELAETSITIRPDAGSYTLQTYTTNLTNTYSGGQLASQGQQNLKNGSDSALADTNQTYGYQYWDGAIQSSISYDSDTASSSNALWTTTYAFDASGHVTTATIADGQPRTATFVTDQNGMVIDRTETKNSGNTTSAGNPRALHYLFGGVQIGTASNNGSDNTSYTTSIATRLIPPPGSPGPFANGAATGTAAIDFDQNYDAINGSSVASTGGSYTCQGGETLAAVAQNVWGDASLWYLLADANGMGGATELTAGQTITIPNKVINRHNSSDTFRPYDPNEALGDTSPTSAAKPPKAKQGTCGKFGQILQSIVTIAVTVALSFTPLRPVAALIGDFVGQTFGVVTGIQQGGYNWKELAHVALKTLLSGGSTGNPFLDALNGAITEVEAQGVEIAVGLKKKFDFTAVAVSAVTAGVTTAVTNAAAAKFHLGSPGADGRLEFNSNTAAAIAGGIGGAAGAVAGAATRSIVTGTDFGDNLIAALPDAIISTAANLAAARVRDTAAAHRLAREDSAADRTAQPAAKSGASGAPVAGLSGGGSSSYTLGGPKGMTIERPLSPMERMLGFDPSDFDPSYQAKKLPPPSFRDDATIPGRNDSEIDQWQTKLTAEHPEYAKDIAAKAQQLKNALRPTDAQQTANANRQSGGNATPSSEAASSPVPGTGQVSVAIKAIETAASWVQMAGDGISSVLSSISNFTYEKSENALNYLEDRGVFNVPVVGDALKGADVALNAVHTVAQGLAALPSAAVHPINTFKGIGYAGARFMDGITAIDSKPAGQFISETLTSAGNLTPRQARQRGGSALGVVAGVFLPVKGLRGNPVAGESVIVAEEGANASRAAASASARAASAPVRGADGRFISRAESPSVLNRSTQYPSGYRAGVVDKVLDANTIRSGPNAGKVRTADGDIVARNDPRLTVEHNKPVVEHWNEIGYKSGRAVRNDFYNDTGNMGVRLRSPNSADGGRMSASGVRYRQDIGSGYSR